jgi:hypothetical protein
MVAAALGVGIVVRATLAGGRVALKATGLIKG